MSAPATALTFPISDLLAGSPYLPYVEAVHIVGFSMLVGAVTVFDLRVLGFARSIEVRALARLCLPWAVLALVAIVPTGLLLFLANAATLLSSSVFLTKMGLLLVAAILAIVFQTGPYGSVAAWNVAVPAPAAAKLIAAASLLVWIAVIFAGRMLREG